MVWHAVPYCCPRHVKADDPLGRDRPSALPAGRPRGEPVPTPGTPEDYPFYYRRVTDPRNARELLLAHIAAQEPKVLRWLYSTITAAADPLKYDEIIAALRAGLIDAQWIEGFWRTEVVDGEERQVRVPGFRDAYADFVTTRLAPLWEQEIAGGAAAVVDDLAAARVGEGILFTQTGQRVQEWIRTRGAELVVEITDGQTQALRHLLDYYTTVRPIHPDDLARAIRPAIGLTPKQAEAYTAYREQLRAQLVQPLEEELAANPRRRRTLEKQLEAAKTKLERKAGQYQGLLHRRRAARIAGTETAYALEFGQREAVLQAREQGFFDGPLMQRWHTAEDERVCRLCGGLDGKIISVDATWPGGTKRVPSTYAPPAHPDCRCCVSYGVAETPGQTAP